MSNVIIDTPPVATARGWAGIAAFFRGLLTRSDQPRPESFLQKQELPMGPSSSQPEPLLSKPSNEESSFFLNGDVLWMKGRTLQTADGRSVDFPDRALCTLHPDVPSEGRDWILNVFSSRFILKDIETAAAHLAATLLHPEAQVTAQDITPVVQGLMATDDGRKIMRLHVSTIEARISEAKSTSAESDVAIEPSVCDSDPEKESDPELGRTETSLRKAVPRRRRKRNLATT